MDLNSLRYKRKFDILRNILNSRLSQLVGLGGGGKIWENRLVNRVSCPIVLVLEGQRRSEHTVSILDSFHSSSSK